MDKVPSKLDQIRALGAAKSSRGSRVALAMADSNISDESRAARKNAAEQIPDSPKHRPTGKLSGGPERNGGVAPVPRETKYDCPVCAARRQAKSASQAKWRRRQAQKRA